MSLFATEFRVSCRHCLAFEVFMHGEVTAHPHRASGSPYLRLSVGCRYQLRL